jgi:arsenite methyltransferase
MSQVAASSSCCEPTCCGGKDTAPQSLGITAVVQEKYGAVAASELSGKHPGVQAVAEAFGYSVDELASIPAEANMGLSCGNPTASANLRPGETVVDLGCGGGLDVFLAAQKVGPVGKAIGIDMTPEMIERAKANAARGPSGQPYTNVEFHLATIDRMPLPSGSVDCVISNCVINLAPDKRAVFREIARVLRPGGRVAVSDIALKDDLPLELAQNAAAWCGCVAGAIPIRAYIDGLREAGLTEVVVVDTKADLNAYAKVEGQAACCSPPASTTSLPVAGGGCCTAEGKTSTMHSELAEILRRHDVNKYAASVKIFALKPAGWRLG